MALQSIARRNLQRHVSLLSASRQVRRNGSVCSAHVHMHRRFSTVSFDGLNNNFRSQDDPTGDITKRASEQTAIVANEEHVKSNSLSDPVINLLSNTLRSNNQPNLQHKAIEAQHEIQTWITTNPRIAPYKAEEKLSELWTEQQQLIQEATSNNTNSTAPTLITVDIINLVLQAWSNSNSGEKGAIRAERILSWMEELSSKEPSFTYPIPNYQSYVTVIEAWSRAAICESSRHSSSSNNQFSTSTKIAFECARRSEDWLMHMQQMHTLHLDSSSDISPDTNAFHQVLNAWSSIPTKATATRCLRIFDLMQELHHYQSLNTVPWRGVGVSKIQPNLGTYKTLLRAWTGVGSAEGADRAELILRHLLSICKAGNVGVEIHPDAECFHVVMKGHADAVRKRRRGALLTDEAMETNSPGDRARQTTSLLDWMELLASRRAYRNVRPTRETYRIALSAWAWSHDVCAPKEAEGILFRMIGGAEREAVDGDGLLERLLGKSNEVGGVKKRNDGKDEYPETRDYNTVINCCAFARGIGLDATSSELDDDEVLLHLQQARKQVFAIAKSVFDSLLTSKHAQPDSDTFLGMIRACISLLPNNEDRDVQVIELFRLAYKTPLPEVTSKPRTTYSETLQAPKGGGCVNANVLRQLRLALPSTEEYIRVREEFEEYRRRHAEE